jgi:hypothetical protein
MIIEANSYKELREVLISQGLATTKHEPMKPKDGMVRVKFRRIGVKSNGNKS